MELLVHSTMHNALYVQTRLDSIIELCPNFPSGAVNAGEMPSNEQTDLNGLFVPEK